MEPIETARSWSQEPALHTYI